MITDERPARLAHGALVLFPLLRAYEPELKTRSSCLALSPRASCARPVRPWNPPWARGSRTDRRIRWEQDIVAALVAEVLGHRGVPVLLTPAGRKSQPIAAVRAEDVADEQGAALTVALVHVPALFKVLCLRYLTPSYRRQCCRACTN